MCPEFSHNYQRELHQFNNNQAEHQAELAPEVEELQEAVKNGIRSVGLSPSGIKTLENNRDGSNIALAAYERGTGSGEIALASIEDLSQQAKTPEEVQQKTRLSLLHELKHKRSDNEANKRGEQGLIAHYFGEKTDHNLQETMASHGTTDGFDAYGPERKSASRFGSLQKIAELLHDGKEAEIVRIGLEKGIKKAA